MIYEDEYMTDTKTGKISPISKPTTAENSARFREAFPNTNRAERRAKAKELLRLMKVDKKNEKRANELIL